MQHVLLVQPGEQQLAAESVVVADPVAGDGEPEDAVEDDGVLHQLGVWFAGRLELDRLAERGEVAAQFLERVQEVRHPLLDHERVERQVAVHVGAVVDHVPHHERVLGQFLIVEQRLRIGGQVQPGDVDRGRDDAAEPGGFPVGEDRAPGEFRDLAHRNGLREQHRGVGVVTGGEVQEADRHEQLVAVFAGLEVGDEVRPDDLEQHRLDETVRRTVLRVHREDNEVPKPVDAVLLRVEGHQRVEEVRHAEPGVSPAGEVVHQGGQVVGRRAETRQSGR